MDYCQYQAIHTSRLRALGPADAGWAARKASGPPFDCDIIKNSPKSHAHAQTDHAPRIQAPRPWSRGCGGSHDPTAEPGGLYFGCPPRSILGTYCPLMPTSHTGRRQVRSSGLGHVDQDWQHFLHGPSPIYASLLSIYSLFIPHQMVSEWMDPPRARIRYPPCRINGLKRTR